MSIPVPRAPKTRFTAPARAVPAPEEVSAGGLIIDFDRPDHEAIDVAWVPLEELPTRLSFANEQHIARSAREYITTQL